MKEGFTGAVPDKPDINGNPACAPAPAKHANFEVFHVAVRTEEAQQLRPPFRSAWRCIISGTEAINSSVESNPCMWARAGLALKNRPSKVI